jgi:hypothetical protein
MNAARGSWRCSPNARHEAMAASLLYLATLLEVRMGAFA